MLPFYSWVGRKVPGSRNCCFCGREARALLLAAIGALPTPFLCRLWKKIWAPVPTPESFFQPLYREHSGNFKVSHVGCTLWIVYPLGEPYQPSPQDHSVSPEYSGPT